MRHRERQRETLGKTERESETQREGHRERDRERLSLCVLHVKNTMDGAIFTTYKK